MISHPTNTPLKMLFYRFLAMMLSILSTIVVTTWKSWWRMMDLISTICVVNRRIVVCQEPIGKSLEALSTLYLSIKFLSFLLRLKMPHWVCTFMGSIFVILTIFAKLNPAKIFGWKKNCFNCSCSFFCRKLESSFIFLF